MKKQWNEGWSGFLVAAALVAAAPLVGAAQAAPMQLSVPVDAKGSTADRAYLGVYVEGEADGGGVKLGEVVEGSPAQKAGLQDGDVIVALGDRTIGSETELRDAIAAFGVGQKVKVTFLREGEKRRTSARLAAAPGETEAEVADDDDGDDDDEGGGRSGSAKSAGPTGPIEILPSNPAQGGDNSGYLGVQLEASDEAGAKVLEVLEGSPAANAGLESGDVIVKVDASDIDSVDALINTIKSHHAGDAVRLTVDRDGERMKIRATLAGRSGMAMGSGGGAVAVPAMPSPHTPKPVPPKPPMAARSATPAPQSQQTRREIEELRHEIQELRERCDQQQRTIEAIRRALDGGGSPGSTSMAMPAPAPAPSMGAFTTEAPSFPLPGAAGGMFAVAAPVAVDGAYTGPIAVAPAVAGSTPSAGGDDCCADAPAAIVMGSGAATCTATCTDSGDATCEVSVSSEGSDGATMVWAGGDDGKVLKVQGAPGKHAFKVTVGDDGEAHVEALEPTQQGFFFGTGDGSDDAKPAKAKALKLKLGGTGGMLFGAPKQEGKKAAVKVFGKPLLPAKTKGFKVAPKAKAGHGGTFEFRVDSADGEGHGHSPHARVLRIPHGMAGVGGLGGFDVKPMRVRVAPRIEMRKQQDACSGNCATHCPARQMVVAGLGGGHGACTLVIRGGQCEVRCEGGVCSMVDPGTCEECEESEDSEDDDSGTAMFELMQVGDEFQLMQASGDEDDDCCSGDSEESDDCCQDDDDGDDDDGDDGDDDDSCCEDEDEGDINYF